MGVADKFVGPCARGTRTRDRSNCYASEGARSMRAVADERTRLLGKDGRGRPHIRMCSLNARGEGLYPYCPQKGWEKEAMLSGRHATLKMPIHAPLEGERRTARMSVMSFSMLQHLPRVTSERTEGQPKIWGKNPLN